MRYSFIFILFLALSCNDNSETVVSSSIDKKKPIAKNDKEEQFIVSTKTISLHHKAKKIVENWQEYQSVAEFIPKFYKTTSKEALFNSTQFYDLSKHLKDSIRVTLFKTPSFKVRLNVLYSEALRLYDMDSIPSITNKEVVIETENIVNAFNAINIKINNVVKRATLTKDLSEFNEFLEKEIDSLKPLINTQKQIKNKFIKPKLKKRKLINKRIKPLKSHKTDVKN